MNIFGLKVLLKNSIHSLFSISLITLLSFFLVNCGGTKSPTAHIESTGQKTGTITSQNTWLPIYVDKECWVGQLKIPAGHYQLNPSFTDDNDGKKNVTKYLLATNTNCSLKDINPNTGQAPDGSFAVVINVIGVATLKDVFSESKARYSSSEQIATIWVGLAGENREWSSEPLNLTFKPTNK